LKNIVTNAQPLTPRYKRGGEGNNITSIPKTSFQPPQAPKGDVILLPSPKTSFQPPQAPKGDVILLPSPIKIFSKRKILNPLFTSPLGAWGGRLAFQIAL